MKNVFLSILIVFLLGQVCFAEGYYYLYDHLGNVDVVTDETGEAVATYEYDPFGNTIEENIYDEEFSNDYKYTGQEEDDETGLYYYNARYYSPSLGRFMSQDPAVYDDRLFELLADPQSLNPYAYARNNPVKYVDPSGEYNVETGVIEEGDTKDGIVDMVNEALGITTDWGTISTVSFFDADKSIGELVAENEFTACGTKYVADITNSLSALISGFSKQAIGVMGSDGLLSAWSYSAENFNTGGIWDIKNSKHPVMGADNPYYSYIYFGKLIRYDAPSNIAFGTVGYHLNISPSILRLGAHYVQQKSTGEWDSDYDQAMIMSGYTYWFQKNK